MAWSESNTNTLIFTVSLLSIGILLTSLGSTSNQSYQNWEKTECNITAVSHSYVGSWNGGWAVDWKVTDMETNKDHTITEKYPDAGTYLAALDTFQVGNSYACYHKTNTDWTWDIGSNTGPILMVIGIPFLCAGFICFLFLIYSMRKR